MRETVAAFLSGWPWALAIAAVVLAAGIAGYAAGRRGGRRVGRSASAPAGSADLRGLVQGVITAYDLAAGAAAVQAQLERALEAARVHRIPVAGGTAFDANRHHAVGTEPAMRGGTDRCVAREIRAGWQTGEQVVRPAEVIVWKR